MNAQLLQLIAQRRANPALRIGSDLAVPPLFAPTTADVLKTAELSLGFQLPAFLVQVYCRVGNGGFGPGYGILGLDGGYEDETIGTLLDHHRLFRGDPEWPERLLPFCDWGCAIRSCVDCSSQAGPVYIFAPDQGEGHDLALTHETIETWFQAWVDGEDLWSEMFEPSPERARELRNPFTGNTQTVTPQRIRRGLRRWPNR